MKRTSKWILLLGFLGTTLGDQKIIDCPKSCAVNVYKPVCSRGKSYANLCVLKVAICKGNIQKSVHQNCGHFNEDESGSEVYQDIEACPGFDKIEDENGASVEMIDRNGVIFRRLFEDDNSHEYIKHSGAKGVYNRRRMPYHYRRRLRAELCRRPCVEQNSDPQICVLGVRYKNLCEVKHLACSGQISFAALGIMEYCDETNENSNDFNVSSEVMDNSKASVKLPLYGTQPSDA